MDKFSAIVLGSGLAGLSVALRLAEAGEKVALISCNILLNSSG